MRAEGFGPWHFGWRFEYFLWNSAEIDGPAEGWPELNGGQHRYLLGQFFERTGSIAPQHQKIAVKTASADWMIEPKSKVPADWIINWTIFGSRLWNFEQLLRRWPRLEPNCELTV